MIGETRTYTVELEVEVKHTSKGSRATWDDPGYGPEFEVTEITLGKVAVSGYSMTPIQHAAQGAELLDAIMADAEEQANRDSGWDDLDPDYLRDAAE